MKFVANLRTETIQAFGQHSILPHAFLLSSHRISPSAIAQAHALRDRGVPLIADNGSKNHIDEILKEFAAPVQAFKHEARQARLAAGCMLRGQAVPAGLRSQASMLATAVVDACTLRSEQVDADELLNLQLAMRPTHLIAQEDFATACLMRLGLERELTGWDIGKFVARNARSLALYDRVRSDPRCREIKVFAVLSAMDYNTARVVGRLAAVACVDHAAMGIAGITLDSTATDFYVMGHASYHLARPTQRRYVRLAQVVRGIVDGYRDAGKELKSFHALGLGAPAMFPIFCAATTGVPDITTDATSPIHDAVKDRVLYDPERNGHRMSTLDIIKEIAAGGEWACNCPFCEAFCNLHRHSSADAAAWFEDQGRPTLTRELVESENALHAALPLFASPKGSERERDASRVHIAHNHFVLGKLAEEYPDGSDRRDFAMAKIDESSEQTASGTTKEGLLIARKILDCPTPR